MHGPTLPISQEIHATKYRGPDESFDEYATRVANATKDGKEHFKAMRDILGEQAFLPGGRIQSAMGSPRGVTAHNCFVSGQIDDSFTEGSSSIMAMAAQAASTMRAGGGIGYDFSTLRPRGALIRKLQSQSSGPVSFMRIFDALCGCIASSGHRRGAQMGVLRVDHPDIEEFVRSKQPSRDVQVLWNLIDDMDHTDASESWLLKQALQKTLNLTQFNISVAITDRFMECLETGEPFPLVFGNEVYKTVDARALWEQIMRSTWDWAEPGVLFIDRINEMNNLRYCETITATNPCGEQPLPPYGACLLGSFNLTKYIIETGNGRQFNYDKLGYDIPHVVRAMDNVIDRSKYPLHEQEQEARRKRRMGLGVTGYANAIEALGLPYGTEGFKEMSDEVLGFIAERVYLASVELAKEKGSFPLYEPRYLDSKFVHTLPSHVQSAIAQHGIRNSHLLSIAPTGTISLTADNISSGIEPVFSYGYDRTIQTFEGPRVERVSDYGVRVFGVHGRTADELTPSEHVSMLNAVTAHVDSAVSKTCNIGDEVGWDEFQQVYIDAYNGGAKGCTTFRAAGKRTGILVSKPKKKEGSLNEEGSSCRIDPTTGRRECD